MDSGYYDSRCVLVCIGLSDMQLKTNHVLYLLTIKDGKIPIPIPHVFISYHVSYFIFLFL